MYFRLMVAMFGLPATQMSESIQLCPIMLLYFKILVGLPIGNLVKSRSNYDIPFTSGMIATILNFCGRGLKLCHTQDITKNLLVIPYRLVKTT
jgi:hypothetical protein